MKADHRILVLPIPAVSDVNECTIGFLGCVEEEKANHESVLYWAVVREAMELDGKQIHAERASNLKIVFRLFYEEMWQTVFRRGRREPHASLLY